MQQVLNIYNSLSRKKEEFKPLNAPNVGLYVCGPTVYGDPHLGHARPAITFDILFRYLTHIGYKVRYVRNITDVGHLENDADAGEDKIAKKARLEQLEPMEVVQYYTNRYHDYMNMLNVLPPSIEPTASGHIIEQQEMIREILKNGYAYESNGSIYFDVKKYNEKFGYGTLSGRNIEEMISNTRELDGQSEKRSSVDFALWKKAAPEHIMRWPSEWSLGFPGWHLECSVMSRKYLGDKFDIHGGGMDLKFPHHECEIAQNTAADGGASVQYWMHNNMITINGQKMGKSLGNFITLEQMFSGEHELLEQAYSPMTIRFFILQAQYRGTLDFSNEALQAAQKGLQKLFKAITVLDKIKASDKSSVNIDDLNQKCFNAINDDINTPVLIANLFDGVKMINSINENKETVTQDDLDKLKFIFKTFVKDVMGLVEESEATNDSLTDSLIEMLVNIRHDAKISKDWSTADRVRDELKKLGVTIKDEKEGYSWDIE
jgi:cysteinyl-tRNA synthetase